MPTRSWQATSCTKEKDRMRKQCQHCPWRKDVDPFDIPDGYCPTKHRALTSTIANPGELRFGGKLRMMACHESTPGAEIPCAGWLMHQLGDGNNIALRMAVSQGHVDADVTLVGEQHATLRDTFPG